MVLELEKCCCCGDLRTGSLIIGYLTLIRDIIVSLVSLIILILGTTRALRLDGITIAVFSILLLIGIANIAFTIVMLVGIHEYKNGHMQVYLIFNAVIIVIAVLLILILCIVAELPALIILGLVFLALHIYYLLVIRSYYLKIDDPMKQPAILRTPEGPPLTAEQLAKMTSESKCCFCVELRVGSILFSYLSMVWNTSIAVLFVLAILDLKATYWFFVVPGMIEIKAVMLGHVLLRLLFIMLLLVGLHTDNHRLIKVFLISHSIFFVVCVALFIANMILRTGYLIRIISSLDIVMIAYFTTEVSDYFTKMNNPGSNPVTQRQQYAMQQQQQYAMQQQQQYATQEQQQYAMQQQPQYGMQQQQYGMQQQQQYDMQQQHQYDMHQQQQYGMQPKQQFDMQQQHAQHINNNNIYCYM